MSKINNKLEYISSLALECADELIERSEIRYNNIIESVCGRIVEDGGHEIVMLAGPSASGKTTTAGKIKKQLEKMGHKAYTVSLDDFYLTPGAGPVDENGEPDFETVYALDIELIEKCISELVVKRESFLPEFDFINKCRYSGKHHIKLDKGDVLIFEGLHALNPVITDKLPAKHLFKIYVSVSSRIYDKNRHIVLNKRNMRFVRRLVRDFNFRASSPENTYYLWQKVTAGEEKYLFPYRFLADARINSIHLYEPCILKNDAIKMLREIDKQSPFRSQAQKLIRSLEKFPEIPKEKIPQDSLLREFVGF